jgi:inner membrane protein
MQAFPSSPELLEGIEDHWPVRRLQWFTKGFYSVERIDRDVIITDLRMGVEDSYVFRFKVAELGNPHAKPTAPERLPPQRDFARVKNVWARIWDRDVTI